jgi:hypothetical protein
MLDNHTVELGAQQRTCFAGCWTRLEEYFLTVPQEFDIKP